MEKQKLEEEYEALKMLLDIYNSDERLMKMSTAKETIDAALDRMSEIREQLNKLNNNPSE